MCYISMNREDGLASAEVVHESLPDEMFISSINCPRCILLDSEMSEELDRQNCELDFSEDYYL